MRRTFTLLLAVLMTLLLAAPAVADTGHFHSATGSVNDSGALVVTFDERGLGTADVNYTLTANATALYACINGGGNHPQAANKESFQGQVSTGGTFQPKNGRVVASLTTGPLSSDGFTCPSGQRLVLASVSYSNILLTDTTNNVSISVPDTSRTFFNV